MSGAASSTDELRRWLVDTSERHGAAVLHVPEDEEHAPYAFSVGAWRRFGKPEVVVIGLPEKVGQSVVDTYVERVRAGERFVPGRLYEGFLAEQPVTFERVARTHYPTYLGSAMLVHGDDDFPALQLLLPTSDTGLFSWSERAPEGFAAYQPVLTDSGAPESWTPGHDGV
ncbi:DUF4262 domain-containing protein [Actinopolyspora erythraea]|uniref:DUF4262 domain-containing protein n=1 Tax=Actinopolyspora erythraea TaxID=414996 RepID=A0A099D572_9ACTN|nr:DUF4262 domain-containing protein [Actinopolyspora erythraea]ASU79424.1 DUF4262 domain-containing protein [Actinopolyspora erythraea]KGI80957.1 hypothetical protein IL38_14445 [Actinopolyspora erythraea]